MSHYQLNYLHRIRELGFRLTPQRQLILDAVCEGDGHATVHEVYEKVRQQLPDINLATVYRGLDFFCELRLATKTEINGRSVYELVGEEPHHHLVCRVCGATAVLSAQDLAGLEAHLQTTYGFTMEMDHLAVRGVCRDCQTK